MPIAEKMINKIPATRINTPRTIYAALTKSGQKTMPKIPPTSASVPTPNNKTIRLLFSLKTIKEIPLIIEATPNTKVKIDIR